MGKTKIIAIEGIDGSGKGVQFRRLKERLEGLGYSVAARDYPEYGSYFGSQVGALLSGALDVKADSIDGRSMALWFALDRWESFKGYEDGAADLLVINRYVLSNAVYQSIRDIDLGKPDIVDWVLDLEYNHFMLPRPDINIVFSVAPETAENNVAKKGFRDYVGLKKDCYESSHDIQTRAMGKYLELADRFGDISVINCMKDGALMDVESISDSVISTLRQRGIIG